MHPQKPTIEESNKMHWLVNILGLANWHVGHYREFHRIAEKSMLHLRFRRGCLLAETL